MTHNYLSFLTLFLKRTVECKAEKIASHTRPLSKSYFDDFVTIPHCSINLVIQDNLHNIFLDKSYYGVFIDVNGYKIQLKLKNIQN